MCHYRCSHQGNETQRTVSEYRLANTTCLEGYVEPEQAIIQHLKAWLEQAVKDCNIRLTNESILFKTGLSASTLPHMNHDVATTPGQRKVWLEKMRERRNTL